MKSMTGYGKCHINEHDLDCDIEIKSINGRFLDLKLFLPRELSFFEFQIRKALSAYIKRGTLEIRVNYTDHREPEMQLNMVKLKKNYEIARLAQESLGLRDDVSLEYLLAIPGVLEPRNNFAEDSELSEVLNRCLKGALKDI